MSDRATRRGMLAIWSDVEPAMLDDYLHWLTREHTAERVGTEGFEGVRVFRADRADINRYLIVYDLATPEVLGSPAYLARLNDPTPWSRRIMPTLRNFARGGGTIIGEAGCGCGGHIAAIRLERRPSNDRGILESLVTSDRICAARLLDVDARGTGIGTNEKELRAEDESFPGLLLVEALDAEAVRDCLSRHRSEIEVLGPPWEALLTYTAIFALKCSS